MNMNLSIDQMLITLSDEFYYQPLQPRAEYKPTPEPGARLAPERALNSQPAWQSLHTSTSSDHKTRRSILLADFRLELLENKLHWLIQWLAASHFELYILTQQGTIEKLDRACCYQRAYLQKIFKQARFGRKALNPDAEDSLESGLKAAGIVDPEQWHILDHYAISQALHAAEEKEMASVVEPTDFCYTLQLNEVLESESAIKQNLHQYLRVEALERLTISPTQLDDDNLKQLFKQVDDLAKNIYQSRSADQHSFPNIQLKYENNDEIEVTPHLDIYPISEIRIVNDSLKKLGKLPKKLKLLDLYCDDLEMKAETDLSAYPLHTLIFRCVQLNQLPKLNIESLENLSIVHVRKSAPFDLSHLTQLKRLHILNDDYIKFLSIPKNLFTLSGRIPKNLSDLSYLTLETLSIENCNSKYKFKLPPTLKAIHLQDDKMDLEPSIAQLPELQNAHLLLNNHFYTLPMNCLYASYYVCVTVASLNLSDTPFIKSLSIKIQGKQLSITSEQAHNSLEILCIYSDSEYSIVKIDINIDQFPKLKTLVLSQSVILKDTSPKNITKLLLQLDTLQIEKTMPEIESINSTLNNKVSLITFEEQPSSPFHSSEIEYQHPDYTIDNETKTDPHTVLTTHYALYQAEKRIVSKFDPSRYRQHIYNTIEYDTRLSFPLSFKQQSADQKHIIEESALGIELVTQFTPAQTASLQPDEYFADFPIIPHSQWIGLPGLTAQDKISCLCMPQDAEIRLNNLSNQYEIHWNPQNQTGRFNLHYVLTAAPCLEEHKPAASQLSDSLQARLTQLFSTPVADEKNDHFKTLHSQISALHTQKDSKERLDFCQHTLPEYFHHFTATESLTLTEGSDDLERMLTQRKGDCRHRAALYVILCQYLGIQARLVTNEIHAFAEIYTGSAWKCIHHLGGASVILREEEQPIEYDPPSQPTETKTELRQTVGSREIAPHSAPQRIDWKPYYLATLQAAPVQTWKTPADVLDSLLLPPLASRPNPLLKIRDLQAGRDLFAGLGQRLSEKKSDLSLYYLESPDQLIDEWLVCQVATDGSIQAKLPGKLQKFIIQGKGVLIINWARFSATQLAANMSINDMARVLQGQPVHPTLKVINLVTPHTPAGDRFYSRCQEITWPATLPWPPLYPALPPHSGSPTLSTVARVDVYGDAKSWRERLLGQLLAHSDQFSYEQGSLGAALHSKKSGLELIDPPAEDPEFQTFIMRLRIERSVMINGEWLDIPPEFVWLSAPAPSLTPMPIAFQQASPEGWQPNPQSYDIFYLNASSFPRLFSRQRIDKGVFTTEPGWLNCEPPSQKTKQIVLTGALSTGQLRCLYETVSALPSSGQTFLWLDLVHGAATSKKRKTLSTPEATRLTSVPKRMPDRLSGAILETTDPAFITRHLPDRKDSLALPIHAHTQIDELFESVSLLEEKSLRRTEEKRTSLRFSQRPLAAAEALQRGDTVVLYGELSAHLYQALEPLYGAQPQLPLLSDLTPRPVKGRLLFITQPLKFTPVLADKLKLRTTIDAKQLWEQYQTQLTVDFPGQKQLLNRIVQFYQLTTAVTHGVIGIPPRVHLSYQRLKEMMTTLMHAVGNDNPLKAFFHHDYDHRSEAYAYLNVVAKLLFGYTTISTQPGVRLDKLQRYPSTLNYVWRRLNCLNAAALAELFELHKLKEPDALLQGLPQFNGMVSYHYTLQTRLADNKHPLKSLSRNADPQGKASQRLQDSLARYNVVTLKGDPGAGKTYAALHYAQTGSRQAFFGDTAVASWLKSKPASGKESVLIIDEANLSQPGYWDFLSPLMEATEDKLVTVAHQGLFYSVSPHHKVIFTCNPEYYPSRWYHAVLQDSPQIYLKSWTAGSLKQHIIDPLLKSQRLDLSLHGQAALSRLLKTVAFANHLLTTHHIEAEYKVTPQCALTSEHLSVRDIQQLIVRWQHQFRGNTCSRSTLPKINYKQAAYEAALLTWGNRFETNTKTQLFRQYLQTIFKPTRLNIIDPQITRQYALTPTQAEWWVTLQANIELADQGQILHKQDGTVLVKLGTLLEGGSGLGKTTLALSLLQKMGFTQLTGHGGLEEKKVGDSGKYFIQFTPSASPALDRERLLTAFHRGDKVVVDELNLDPSLETLLNQLLSGKTPEGRVAQKPGFYVIASQNGSHHAGSQPSSLALKNRLNVINACLTPADLQARAVQTLADVALFPVERQIIAEEMVADFLEVQARQPKTLNTRNFFQALPIKKDQMIHASTLLALRRAQQAIALFIRIPFYHLQDGLFFLEGQIDLTLSHYPFTEDQHKCIKSELILAFVQNALNQRLMKQFGKLNSLNKIPHPFTQYDTFVATVTRLGKSLEAVLEQKCLQPKLTQIQIQNVMKGLAMRAIADFLHILPAQLLKLEQQLSTHSKVHKPSSLQLTFFQSRAVDTLALDEHKSILSI